MTNLPGSESLRAIRARLSSETVSDEEREALLTLLAIIDQQAAELDALKRISLNLTSTLDIKGVLVQVAEEAMKLVKFASDIHIYLYENGRLVFGTAMDRNGPQNEKWGHPRPNGLTNTVARTKKLILVEDMRAHPLYEDTPPDWQGSIVGIPLMYSDMVIGVLNLSRSITGPFSESELRLLRLLSELAAIAIINARLHASMSTQAYTDTLTGLPNRRALDETLENEIQRARRYHHYFAVIMMDLDGFKAINDTYGHEIGDFILKKSFSFLNSQKRNTDFLARYGGDELTMILPETTLNAAVIAASKLQEKLRALKVELPDGTLQHLDISGGIAVYPFHGHEASELLRAADAALYRAKKSQRGTFVIAPGPTGELPNHST
ncbi:MAG: sensor domain-containing diguanylate cyclase [Anaerolineales bacterium]